MSAAFSSPSPSFFLSSRKRSSFIIIVHTALTQLLEADVVSVLTEALTAHVQLVLADDGLLVGADDAAARALAHADLLARTPLIKVSHDVLVLGRRGTCVGSETNTRLFFKKKIVFFE